MIVRELITLLGFKLEDGPQKQYDKQIDNTKEKSNGLTKAAKGIGTAYKVAAAVAVVGIGWISKNIIAATVEMEGYRTQIQAFTGDAESAAAVLADLRDKTVDPLFGTGNLINAYKQLRTVGMGATETSRMIDVLGDVANGSVENFNALNSVLLKVGSTGKVNDGTMRSLAAAGFGAQDMAQGLGISVEKLNADLAAGKIGFDDLKKAMEGATKEGGRFYMNAANQALTLGGSLKIIKSLVSDIGEAIGQKAAPALANLIGYITDLIKIGKGGLIDFGAKAFNYLIHMIAQVIIFFEVLQMRMAKYGGTFTPLKAIFADVFNFLKGVVRSAYPFLMNLAQLFLVAFKPIQAFVKPVLESLLPIIQKVFGVLSRIIEGLIPKVNGLTPLFSKLGHFIGSIIKPLLMIALAIRGVNTALAIGKGAMAAFKTAQLGATGVQWALNAAMAANPIGLIILAVIALIGVIVLLVKNLDKVGAFFKKVGTAIAGFFKALWNAVVGIFTKIVSFVKKNALNILNVILAILFFPLGVIMAVVRLIIKHWDTIKATLIKVWTVIAEKVKVILNKIVAVVKSIVNKVKAVWQSIWSGLVAVVQVVIDGVKAGWTAFVGFITRLWDGIKNIAGAIWDGIKNVIVGVVDGIKNVWNGIVTFFAGLWEAIKQGPTAVFEYIKNAFFNLFDGIKEKFFGFINIIKEGWEKVKGFFGGIKDTVVNFVTGSSGDEATPVNDMILTPQGQFSTHPDDYIMAMKKPGDLIDALMKYLGGPQLAYAGAGGGDSLMGSAMSKAAAQNTYNNSNSSNTSNISAPISVNVNASGMTPEMASAAVKHGVENALKEAISGSRGTIPSPEARRN